VPVSVLSAPLLWSDTWAHERLFHDGTTPRETADRLFSALRLTTVMSLPTLRDMQYREAHEPCADIAGSLQGFFIYIHLGITVRVPEG